MLGFVQKLKTQTERLSLGFWAKQLGKWAFSDVGEARGRAIGGYLKFCLRGATLRCLSDNPVEMSCK